MASAYEGERRDRCPRPARATTWTATRFNIFAPSWNTDQVSGT